MAELKPIKDFFAKDSANPEPKKPDHHRPSHHDHKDHNPHHEEQDHDKKKENTAQDHKSHHKNDDEEISLDFGKIKQWFKKGRTIKDKPHKTHKKR